MSQFHPLWLIGASVLIALAPVLMGLFTSYVKISVVLGMLRSGLGAQQVPGNAVLMALSFAITCYVMAPCLNETAALAAKLDWAALSSSPRAEMLQQSEPLLRPWCSFMRRHSGERELKALLLLNCEREADSARCLHARRLAQGLGTAQEERPPAAVLAAAFVLSELKEGFAMGFALLLPFLVVDLIVANVLAGMGMFMLSPMLVSLPLKLILFIVCDGWLLLTRGLVSSYLY